MKWLWLPLRTAAVLPGHLTRAHIRVYFTNTDYSTVHQRQSIQAVHQCKPRVLCGPVQRTSTCSTTEFIRESENGGGVVGKEKVKKGVFVQRKTVSRHGHNVCGHSNIQTDLK